MLQAGAEVAVVAGERLARYGFPNGHPFGPDRHAAFMREFIARGLDQRVRLLDPVQATSDELLTFHTPDYLRRVQELSATGSGTLDAGDTPAYRGVYEAAACVVGSALVATEWIMAGERRHAFVPIAGLHHAGRDHAAGFCVFNDCGVVIERLRARHGLKCIAYVDIDAHHGDGVYYAYEDDPQLIFADMHESGASLYPGTGSENETGTGAAQGTKLNIPLPAGSGDAEFREAWRRMLDHVGRFEPQFFILQCGADSVDGDPLTHLHYSAAMHGQAAADLCALAGRIGHGRVLALGGGGYDRGNLAAAWSGVVSALLEH
jgi:acetoin utilization protein AcuC